MLNGRPRQHSRRDTRQETWANLCGVVDSFGVGVAAANQSQVNGGRGLTVNNDTSD